MIMKTVTESYLMGIEEGRCSLNNFGGDDACARVRNLKDTAKGFKTSSPVGQMLRGELDFWKNYLKGKK